MEIKKFLDDNVKLDLHNSILLIKPTEDRYGYEFPIRIFEAQIREYLNLVPAFGGRERGEDWIYGFENYHFLTAYVEDVIQTKGADFRNDIRGFCVLLDHKRSLCHTFAYFERQGELENGFSEHYNRIVQKTFLIRNLVLKLYFKYTENTAVSLLHRLKELMAEEQEVLHCFLERQSKSALPGLPIMPTQKDSG